MCGAALARATERDVRRKERDCKRSKEVRARAAAALDALNETETADRLRERLVTTDADESFENALTERHRVLEEAWAETRKAASSTNGREQVEVALTDDHQEALQVALQETEPAPEETNDKS